MAEHRAWLSPAVKGGVQLAFQIALSLALFAVLVLLTTRHNVRYDLTPAKTFALSDSARQVAEGLDRPARLTVFYNSQMGDARRDMADLLEQFHSANAAVTYRMFDLDRSPALAKKFGISSYNTGVVEVGDDVLPLRSVDEGEITSVLLSLSRRASRTVCFVTGHGERDPYDADERSGYSGVGKALERERFAIEALATIPAEGVPSRCTVVVMAGPSHNLLPGEDEALLRYLRGGGRVLMLVDPDAPASVIAFLRGAGIEARGDLIVDQRNRFIGADSFMPPARFRPDVFQNRLDAPVVLSMARPVGIADPPAEGIKVMSIGQTSPDSWALVGTTTPPDQEPRPRGGTDEPGPLSVGVFAQFSPAAPDAAAGELMVIGDSDFATNFYLDLLGNRDLILSAVAVLAEDPALVAVRRKSQPGGTLSPISLTSAQSRTIFVIAVVVAPLVCLAFGGLVGLRRLRHRGGR